MASSTIARPSLLFLIILFAFFTTSQARTPREHSTMQKNVDSHLLLRKLGIDPSKLETYRMSMANSTAARTSLLLLVILFAFFVTSQAQAQAQARTFGEHSTMHKNVDNNLLSRKLGFDPSKLKTYGIGSQGANADRDVPGGPDPHHHSLPPF
ncbi:hypothetical protein F0562_008483 [Nyssa sinensis]|uniref:Uncharacterized protein n=1 Tax=Nyssa sinensis TaxID=561372 RepID=A0A5J5A7X5_9ASTE|nr:hypothetical protein F0562_008483 [Nyssa sinensis]